MIWILSLHTEAVKFDRLTYDDVLQKGLRVMDAAGIALAKEDNLPIMVLNMARSREYQTRCHG